MGFRSTNFLFDSPAAAVAALAARVRITPPLRSSEVVELTAASGRILAIDFRTDRDSPPFDYAAMDGYAICLADVAEWMESETVLRDTSCVYTLSVVGEVLIGKAPPAYCRAAAPPGTLRIVTGAPIPHGVDTIIRREDVLEHATECGGEVASISFTAGLVASLKRSQHVHIEERMHWAERLHYTRGKSCRQLHLQRSQRSGVSRRRYSDAYVSRSSPRAKNWLRLPKHHPTFKFATATL